MNPYAEMVRGYKNRFTSTILSQIQIEQDLNFITEGLSLRALAAIKSYSSNENLRSFTPFYYGVAETETESGVTNTLYQIQEGTEYLDRNDIYNYVNSNYYYEFVTQYDRLFSEKHQVGGLLVFNFSESMNTISGNLHYRVCHLEIWGFQAVQHMGMMIVILLSSILDTMVLKNLLKTIVSDFSHLQDWAGLSQMNLFLAI